MPAAQKVLIVGGGIAGITLAVALKRSGLNCEVVEINPQWTVVAFWTEIGETSMSAVKNYLPPLARLLMASLFIWDGFLQLRDPGGTAKYFADVHVPMPDVTVWISIVVHLLGGLGILVGFKIRWAAAALALLCLGTAFGVHLPVGDTENLINFYKNLVMSGGFLYIITYGAGVMSMDGMNDA
jgi:putative oxidoreductase